MKKVYIILLILLIILILGVYFFFIQNDKKEEEEISSSQNMTAVIKTNLGEIKLELFKSLVNQAFIMKQNSIG
jgi:flagellar basal body-associated protein FliL